MLASSPGSQKGEGEGNREPGRYLMIAHASAVINGQDCSDVSVCGIIAMSFEPRRLS